LSYDSVQRHLAIEKLVTRAGVDGQERKYYRVRSARWYGGIVTADCVGCGLLCKFCWVSDSVMTRPADVGKFYTSIQIAGELDTLAKRKHLNQLRVSGGEPTIGKRHLLELLGQLQNKGYNFILETNGILIGHDENYARDLSKYNFIHTRISLKGCNEQEFATLTGAKPEGFKLQLKSLQYLIEARVRCHPSVITSFSTERNLHNLIEQLKQINPNLVQNLELEELILYPHVIKRIQKYNLEYSSSHRPNKIPPQQI
jgi:uncharacterized Fe-S cluster-containing radical SAM superfamily protein